jgi:hypothetical protein
MVILVMIIATVFLFNSFSKFNSWMRQNESKLIEANVNLRIDVGNLELIYIKAVCLMNLQNYPAAIIEFEKIIASQGGIPNWIFDDALTNLAFCQKPLPWSSFCINRSGSYMHYLFLSIAGNKRVTLT